MIYQTTLSLCVLKQRSLADPSLCAQFLAADAEASATAALVEAEGLGFRHATAPAQQPQPQEAAEAAAQQASGALPVSGSETAPVAASVAKESEVAPAPLPAA